MAFRRFKRRRRFYKRRFGRKGFRRFAKRYSTPFTALRRFSSSTGLSSRSKGIIVPWGITQWIRHTPPKVLERLGRVNAKGKQVIPWVRDNIVPVLRMVNSSRRIANKWAVMAIMSAASFVTAVANGYIYYHSHPRVQRLAQIVTRLLARTGIGARVAQLLHTGRIAGQLAQIAANDPGDIWDLEQGDRPGYLDEVVQEGLPQLQAAVLPRMTDLERTLLQGVVPRNYYLVQGGEALRAKVNAGELDPKYVPMKMRQQIAYNMGLKAPVKVLQRIRRPDPLEAQVINRAMQDMIHAEQMQMDADRTVGEGVVKFSKTDL